MEQINLPHEALIAKLRRTGTMCAVGLALIVLAATLWPACSINVKKAKGGDDDDEKQVDIKSPFGGIHVSKDADAADIGLAVYPGARPKQKDNGNDKNANVNISGFGYGIKVEALEYESDDAPAKLVDFYKDQLKKYGSVLVCHTSNHLNVNTNLHDDSDKNSRALTCEGSTGVNVELKAGVRDNQHIVAVEPEGKGSSFSLVYVRTHGKEADI
jgi:hypothetical protein